MVTTTKSADTPEARSDASDFAAGAATLRESLPEDGRGIGQTCRPEFDKRHLPNVAILRTIFLPQRIERAFDSVAQMQAELACFGAQRMRRALEGQAKVRASRSPTELHEVQTSYMRDLAADYAHAWIRLFGYGMHVGLGQTVPLPPEPRGEHHATPV